MSKFSMFSSVKAQRGERCTQDKFNEVSASPVVRDLCESIAAETDHDKQGLLKKQLPIITFQAYFAGARKNALAEPSGVSIYDGDDMENPREFYEANVAPRIKELGILYAGMTPSRHGLRLVFSMRPEFASIAEAQKWISGQIGWECDPACKDLARASYVVPKEYVYYLDPALFDDEPTSMTQSVAGLPPAPLSEGEAQSDDKAPRPVGSPYSYDMAMGFSENFST